MSTRHPYQPISELLRKEVDTFKKQIHSQIESIRQYREINSEFKEDSQNDGSCRRYCYPPSEKYSRLENNNVFKVVGGRHCESSNARDFKISNNELIAFQINSEAKFTKVYREGIRKCFLMPSEFKDDAMRNFFRFKFDEFVSSSANFIMKDDDHRSSFLSFSKYSASGKADFSEEHSARREIELDYARGRGTDVNLEDADVKIEFSSESNHVMVEDYLPPVSDDYFMLKGDGGGMTSSLFNREADRSQKHFLDAREVCLTDWEVRNMAQELLNKLCLTMKELISGKDVESDCKDTEVLTSKSLFEQVDLYFRLLRKTNEESESKQQISQILDNTLVILEDELTQMRELRYLDNCTEVDKQLFRDRIDAQYNFYVTLGTHSTSLFYEKHQIYQNLKSRPYKICCVCGIKSSIADKSTELKNAVAFKELLVVEDRELAEWKGLKKNDEDERGALAQECFHIASVEYEQKHYHILNIDDPDPDNLMELSCCLIKDGKLLRLPACDECYDHLRKAHKFLKETVETKEYSASLNSSSGSNDGGLLRWDTAVRMLKGLSFKRCDLGRIPKSLPKLSSCERTAIAPFVAYTIIRQLRCSRYLPGSAQHSSKGSKFSIPTDGVAGKEFVIPLLHDEFVNSFQKDLPRENIATRHRVLFLGNNKDWRSMESTLNRQNRGQSFNVADSYNFLKLLKKTGALSPEFTVKRKSSLGLLQRKVDMEMSRISNTTDSSAGIVLEPSQRIQQMDTSCSDDVAAARLLTENDGMKSAAPGITSSLFWNKASHDSKIPLLKSMLGGLPGARKMDTDSLLLKIKRELPNEFVNFSEITTHTFPDLFPIPLNYSEANPLNFKSVNVRRHLLDFYDGRFCDKMFIFWMFGILTRHKSVYETCAFFKRDTDARRKYEKMVNDPDLEAKLERAIKNEDSKTAKKLNEKFSGLLRIVGGNTPWSTLERRATLGKLKALCGFFGLPSIFLTIAPCIADSEICISLCNNLQCNYRMKESTHQERSRWTAANPVASAKAFRLIIDTVVHIFIGIPTGNLRRSTFTDVGNGFKDNDTVLAERFENHLRSRRGFLGVSQAFFGIFEPQGRAALHMHSLVWTILNSELIARCSKRQLEFLCIAIDKVIATWIHPNDVKDEEWEKDIPQLSQRCALREVPTNMNLLKLGSFSKRIMYRVQYHGRCSFTCFKSKGFTGRCRLAKPSEEFPKTVFHLLRENRAITGEILIPIRETIIDPPPVIGNLSIPTPESRIHWLDHKRLNPVDGNMVDGNLSISASLG